jgi:hypothetical protein
MLRRHVQAMNEAEPVDVLSSRLARLLDAMMVGNRSVKTCVAERVRQQSF